MVHELAFPPPPLTKFWCPYCISLLVPTDTTGCLVKFHGKGNNAIQKPFNQELHANDYSVYPQNARKMLNKWAFDVCLLRRICD